jgi:hypothetical protein
MPIINPSQYDCDKMKPGDTIYIKPRNIFYKIYRNIFMKDAIKILVRKDWKKERPDYIECYQEDCILFFNYENQCIQVFKDVPYQISNKSNKFHHYDKLDKLIVNLYEVQLVFKSGEVYTLHLDDIKRGIDKNNYILKQLDRNEIIQQNIKFQKYKGDTFKNIVKERNIKSWNFNYCFLCGKPLTCIFEDDKIYIKNECDCGNTKVDINSLSYDDFAIWFCSQTDSNIIKIYKKFWFNKEE